MAEVTSILKISVRDPDTPGTYLWEKEFEVFNHVVTGTSQPENTSGRIINSKRIMNDMQIINSSTLTLAFEVNLKEDTMLEVERWANRLLTANLRGWKIDLTVYYYDPETKDRVAYDTTTFPEASHYTPYNDSYHWILNSYGRTKSSQDFRERMVKLPNGQYKRTVQVAFMGIYQGV